ncbi:hypothetical protein, partial [Sinorhizobium meliloti]|uniref:hypothetical protein n=1 Tax=Rhizobium meliloti TaxID=382 RepID=UPI001AECACF8
LFIVSFLPSLLLHFRRLCGIGATESLQFSVVIAGRTASNDFHRIVAHVWAQPSGLPLTPACETGSESTPPWERKV